MENDKPTPVHSKPHVNVGTIGREHNSIPLASAFVLHNYGYDVNAEIDKSLEKIKKDISKGKPVEVPVVQKEQNNRKDGSRVSFSQRLKDALKK